MRNAITRATLATSFCLLGLSSALAWNLISERTGPSPSPSPLARAEQRLRRVPAHISEFTPVSEPLALPRCGDVRPPEALATPDPMLQLDQDEHAVKVSFIVGADGRVHCPFILDCGGPREDQVVLRAVRRWRYRPAMCNGVPTDSEARVQFSIP